MSITEAAREAHEAKQNEGGPRQFKRNSEATPTTVALGDEPVIKLWKPSSKILTPWTFSAQYSI